VTVLINPIPAAPTAGSNSPLCAGQTLSLTASAIAAATYSWTGPNSFTSNTQNPSIAGTTTLANGVYSVKATVGGCAGPNGTVSVLINPTPLAPTVGSNSPLCAGQTLSLTASIIAGATYSWTGPNSFTSNIQNPSIAGTTTLASGVYSVNSTLAGCAGPNGTVSVLINSIPAAPIAGSNSPLCAGQTLSLTASAIAGATYSWTGPNSFTLNTQNPSIVGTTTLASGVYSVNATVAGCAGPNGTVSVLVNPLPPSGFTSTNQNPSIAGTTTLATGVYSVNATLAGCAGPNGTVSVLINSIPAAPIAGSNSPLCAGQTLSLTASTIAGATYSWTGPNSFTSNTQNPSIAGTTTLASGVYSVNATLAGCAGPNGTVSVLINPIPAAPTASANTPLCVGSTLSLTSTFTAGASYNWSGPNSFTSNTQNPSISNITLAGNGNYSVTSTILGCTSSVTTVSVLVSPLPATPTASANSPLCVGQTLSLSASTIASATYSWTGPNSFTSNIQSPSIVGSTTLASGVYSVNVTVGGCTGTNGTVSVLVNPLPLSPTATANSPLCTGQTLSLTASTIAGATYSWTGPNSFTSSIQNPIIVGSTTLASGDYSVQATIGGCTGPIGTVSVTVNPTPVAPLASANTTLCSGSTINFTASTVGASTYSWSGPNGFTSTNQTPSIVGATTLATGNYSVYATDLGCQSSAGVVSVTVIGIPSTPTLSSNSAVCETKTLNLSTSLVAGATYSWSGPNSFTSNTQNPTISGITLSGSGVYSLITTVSGCSSSTGTTNVVVNPIPAAPLASANTTLCLGSTINFTASTIGASTYSWTGPNNFTSIIQNPTIIGASTLATGNYSVYATEFGCQSSAGVVSITVIDIPITPTITSNSPLCSGQTLSLNSTFVLGVDYNWNGPNSFTASIQNPSIVNSQTLAAGIYSLFLSVSGCQGITNTVSIVVTSPATLSTISNTIVCANNSTLGLNGVSSTGNGFWTTSGTGLFSPSSTSLITNYIPSIADINSGLVTLTLTSTNNGACSAASLITTLSITPSPSVTAGSSQTVCINNATISLSGSVSIASGGIWTSSGTGTFTPDNLTLNANYLPSAADITSGSFVLTLSSTGNGNCLPVSENMTVTISPAPIVNPGFSPQTVCKNNPNFTLNGTSTTGSVVWLSSGTGSFTPSNTILNPTYVPSSADTTAGAVTLTLTSTNNGGCNAVSQTMTIVYISTLSVNAGTDQVVCANNSSISLIGISTTSAGIWTSSGTGTFSPSSASLVTSYIPSTADINAGLVTLTLTTSNNGGCNPITDVLTVSITPSPTVFAGSSQTVCANNSSVNLSGSVSIASGGIWTSSGTGTFIPNNLTLNANYLPSAADITLGSFVLTLSSTGNGNCLPVSENMTVTISPAPIVNPGFSPQTVCKNNPNFTLNGTSTTGSGVWLSSGTGSFTPGNTILNPTYVPSTSDTTSGAVTLTLTSTNNGGCNAVSQTMTIVYISTLSVNAGTDQAVCVTNGSISLNGVSTTSAGIWATNGTGTFSPSSGSLITSYMPSALDMTLGVVVFTLTSVNNAGCNPVSSVVTLTINPGPIANAGVSQTVCANNSSVALTGSFSIAAGAIWLSSGTGTFSPNTLSMNTNYFASSADTTAGSVVITLSTTSNGSCTAATNTILINFSPAPLVNGGGSYTACKNNPNVILGGYSSTGSGTWTSSGTGTFSPNNSVLNPTYIPSTADTLAGSVTLTLTSINNGGCNFVNDVVTISYTGIPSVFAGLSQTVCANNALVVLTGTSSTGSGTWTSSGSGTFTPNSISGSYIPSSSDISNGIFTLTLNSTNNGGCSAVSQQITINVTPAPILDAGLSQTVCANSNSVILTGSITNASGVIWTSSGTGTFLPSNTLTTVAYVPSSADTAAGSVVITLSSNGNGNCIQVTNTVGVTFISAPFVFAGNNLALCPNAANPTLNGVSSTGSATWTTLGTGTFSPNNIILNPVYIPSSLDNSAGTVTLILKSSNLICGSVVDSLVISFNTNPIANFTLSNRCVNSVSSFTDLSTPVSGSITSWLWHFDSDTTKFQNPNYTFTTAGNHTVSLLVSNGSCKDSLSTNIFINPLPVSAFSFTSNCKDSVVFVQSASVTPGIITNWNWNFGDASPVSILQNPVHLYSDTGYYQVTLLVKSDSNCVADYKSTVHIDDCEVVIISNPAVPSGFTPNGDGRNDVLFVKGGPFKTLEFRIFNEWGAQIFLSNIQSIGWDGTFKAAEQAGGRYIWTVIGELIDGRQVKMSGEVILTR